MRAGRVASGSVSAAAAWTLALIAGCADPPGNRVAHRPARPVVEPNPCVDPSTLDNADLLPECVTEDSADPEPTCIPREARGREIARDDEEHISAYELCVPESRYAMPARLRIHPGRVIVERSGERPARSDELDTITHLLANNQTPSRAPDLPDGRPAPREGLELSARPEMAYCWKAGPDGPNCLEMHVVGPRPDPARLLAGIAKWLPNDHTCIAIRVDFGWREGCPEGPGPMVPQSR